jgi:hypothetical protein
VLDFEALGDAPRGLRQLLDFTLCVGANGGGFSLRIGDGLPSLVGIDAYDDNVIEEVLLDAAASPGEVAQVEGAFTRAGFQVKPEAAIEHRAAGAVPWVVMVILGTPIVAFLRAFGEEAGRDAYGESRRGFWH